MQGKDERGLGLCASMCTLSVYWLVNRLSHPMIMHGKRRRCCCASVSIWDWEGEGSRDFEVEGFGSGVSRLEHESAGE